MVGQHDNGNLRPQLFDLSRDDCSIQKAKVILEHNCVHVPRHEKPQTLATARCRYQFVSVLLQKTQLSGVPVYAQHSAAGRHDGKVYREPSGNSAQYCSRCNNDAVANTCSRAQQTGLAPDRQNRMGSNEGQYQVLAFHLLVNIDRCLLSVARQFRECPIRAILNRHLTLRAITFLA